MTSTHPGALKLSKQQQRLINLLVEGPKTIKELSVAMYGDADKWTVESVRSVMAELRKKGFLLRSERRKYILQSTATIDYAPQPMLNVRREESFLQVLRYIIDYKRENDGIAPSYDEIRDACGLSSKSVVYSLVQDLISAGKLRLVCKGSVRNIAVVGGQWVLANPVAEMVANKESASCTTN